MSAGRLCAVRMHGSFKPRAISTESSLPGLPGSAPRSEGENKRSRSQTGQNVTPRVQLGGMASDISWMKRLSATEQRAASVDRTYNGAYVFLFPPVPYFTIDDRTYFIVRDAYENRAAAIARVGSTRTDGIVPTPCVRGHWICPHFACDAGANPITAADMDPDAAANIPAVAGGAARNPLANCKYTPYPTPRGLLACDAGRAPATDAARDPLDTPDWMFTKLYVHVLPAEAGQYDVSVTELRVVMDAAERADYRFALRMQGLQNATLEAVWPGADRHNSQRDVTELTNLFMSGYVADFIKRWGRNEGLEGSVLPQEVIREVIHMHKEFVEEWDDTHKRSLSPALQAGAEAFVGMFVSHPTLQSIPSIPDKWCVLSRYFIRHPSHSAVFSICLHSYMVKLEQDRGSRNANYKSMTNAGTSLVTSMNTMSKYLTQNAADISGELLRLLVALPPPALAPVPPSAPAAGGAAPPVPAVNPPHYCLHPYFVDWHWISSELPVGHVRFQGYVNDTVNHYRTSEGDDIMMS